MVVMCCQLIRILLLLLHSRLLPRLLVRILQPLLLLLLQLPEEGPYHARTTRIVRPSPSSASRRAKPSLLLLLLAQEVC
jgi:hypothetical protein